MAAKQKKAAEPEPLSDDARFIAGKLLGNNEPATLQRKGKMTQRARAAIGELVERGVVEVTELQGGASVIRPRVDCSDYRQWLRAQPPGTVSFPISLPHKEVDK